MSKAAKLGRTPLCLVNALADIKVDDGKNLLHLAAGIAAQVPDEDNTRYFKRLLDLNFPLYNMDEKKDFPPFLICGIRNDNEFLSCYYALTG